MIKERLSAAIKKALDQFQESMTANKSKPRAGTLVNQDEHLTKNDEMVLAKIMKRGIADFPSKVSTSTGTPQASAPFVKLFLMPARKAGNNIGAGNQKT